MHLVVTWFELECDFDGTPRTSVERCILIWYIYNVLDCRTADCGMVVKIFGWLDGVYHEHFIMPIPVILLTSHFAICSIKCQVVDIMEIYGNFLVAFIQIRWYFREWLCTCQCESWGPQANSKNSDRETFCKSESPTWYELSLSESPLWSIFLSFVMSEWCWKELLLQIRMSTQPHLLYDLLLFLLIYLNNMRLYKTLSYRSNSFLLYWY